MKTVLNFRIQIIQIVLFSYSKRTNEYRPAIQTCSVAVDSSSGLGCIMNIRHNSDSVYFGHCSRSTQPTQSLPPTRPGLYSVCLPALSREAGPSPTRDESAGRGSGRSAAWFPPDPLKIVTCAGKSLGLKWT